MKKLRLLLKIVAVVLFMLALQACPSKDSSNDCLTCRYVDEYGDVEKFTVCEENEDIWEDYSDSWAEFKEDLAFLEEYYQMDCK